MVSASSEERDRTLLPPCPLPFSNSDSQTGWVLWRDAPGAEPQWRYGTLTVSCHGGRDSHSSPCGHGSYSSHSSPDGHSKHSAPDGHSRYGRHSSPDGHGKRHVHFVPGEEVLENSGAGGSDASGPGAHSGRQPGSQVWIVPGFVDLHCHLAIGGDGPGDVVLMRESAEAEIRAGVLAIRQPGTPVPVPSEALPHGRPIVVDAGRHIARERRYIRGIGVEIADPPLEAADGLNPETDRARNTALERDSVEARLVAEVRKQAQASRAANVRNAGARNADVRDAAEMPADPIAWVKLVGDWIDRSNGEISDLDPLWTRAELTAAVDAAHAAGARVCVHTFSHAAIDDLIAARVDSIEHGSGMGAAQMKAAADAGIPVVPTTSQILKFPEFAHAATGKYPVYAATMEDMYARRLQWFQDLLTSEVQLLPGSDAGGYQPHGSVVAELQRWVQWGMPPAQALAAATWKARDFLGLRSLSEGAPADFLVFDSDPQADSKVWKRPIQVVANGSALFTPSP